MPEETAGHPDRIRWNAKYEARPEPSFAPHALAEPALSSAPDGPVLDLACGPSGSALLAAARGRPVTAVDISEVALDMLAAEARRRGLETPITTVHADLAEWRAADRYALVICTGYWDRDVFGEAVRAVRPGGVLAWEAFTLDARNQRPDLPERWCLRPGEPASLLPAGFAALDPGDLPPPAATKRRLLARAVSGGAAA